MFSFLFTTFTWYITSNHSSSTSACCLSASKSFISALLKDACRAKAQWITQHTFSLTLLLSSLNFLRFSHLKNPWVFQFAWGCSTGASSNSRSTATQNCTRHHQLSSQFDQPSSSFEFPVRIKSVSLLHWNQWEFVQLLEFGQLSQICTSFEVSWHWSQFGVGCQKIC